MAAKAANLAMKAAVSDLAIEQNPERNRWEAQDPNSAERTALRDLGWQWDRVHTCWWTADDQKALAAMGLVK